LSFLLPRLVSLKLLWFFTRSNSEKENVYALNIGKCWVSRTLKVKSKLSIVTNTFILRTIKRFNGRPQKRGMTQWSEIFRHQRLRSEYGVRCFLISQQFCYLDFHYQDFVFFTPIESNCVPYVHCLGTLGSLMGANCVLIKTNC
jgi:hypothetical protein